MVPVATLIACFVTLFISLLLPVIAIFILWRRHKGSKPLSAWLLGAAGFVVTQLLIRLPLLTALQNRSWFMDLSENNGFLFAFFLAFTAGLFELAGRFAVAKLMQKDLTCTRALAAGLGHGGIEAMILIGITYMNNIAYIFIINSGAFDAVVNEALAAGVNVSSLILLKDQLLSTSPFLFLLGGFERVLAMIGQLAMSMLVCYGVFCGKPVKGALVCLSIHTLIDLTAGIAMLIGNGLTETVAYLIIYSILICMAIISIFIIRSIRRRWKNLEVNYV